MIDGVILVTVAVFVIVVLVNYRDDRKKLEAILSNQVELHKQTLDIVDQYKRSSEDYKDVLILNATTLQQMTEAVNNACWILKK